MVYNLGGEIHYKSRRIVMGVNGITNATKTYDNNGTSKARANSKQEEVNQKDLDNKAAVYEKSDQQPDDKKIYKADIATIDRMKAEADRRTQNLRNLVEKLLMKQGQTVDDATDIYALLREGKVQVDPQTKEQAQKDIAEDGYWGVEQTSDRILSFAKALSGGDPSKADELIEAVKKGFKEATKTWGGDLPGICSKTIDTAIGKLEAWRDGKEYQGTSSNGTAKQSAPKVVTD
jgi:hypothetical protein